MSRTYRSLRVYETLEHRLKRNSRYKDDDYYRKWYLDMTLDGYTSNLVRGEVSKEGQICGWRDYAKWYKKYTKRLARRKMKVLLKKEDF